MKMQYFFVLMISSLFQLLTFVPIVCAQPKHMQFRHLTNDDGLSSSIITTIIQDSKGIVWIGTDNGLNRYDGFEFTIYKNSPSDSASIVSNYILSAFEDRENNLFIGTQSGLCLYDRKKDRFFNYFLEKSSPLKGLQCDVFKVIEDSPGNFWLATNAGLIYFDRHLNKINHYVHDPDNIESLSDDTVTDIFVDGKSQLWVLTRKGLNIFLPETGTFKHINRSEGIDQDLSNTIFSCITSDWDGNIWMGSTEGLYCVENSKEREIPKITHYQFNANDENSLSINQVISLFVDDSGNLWVGTENGGLELFDKKGNKFWHYRKDDYNPKSLNNESVQTIYQDKAGNIWLGTFAGGLNIATKNSEAIINFQVLPGAPFSLSHSSVTCFLEDKHGQTWVGTDGGGLNRFDIKTNRFLRFNKDNSNFSSDAILCLLEDSNDQIWMGTWAGGLISFNVKTKKCTSLTTKNSGIQDDNIFAVAKGENNDLWLGSFENGLIHYQVKDKKFTSFNPKNSGLQNIMVVKIAKYTKGRLIIGSPYSLQIFSPADNHFDTYVHDTTDSHSLSNSRITDILVENDSSVWVGTPNGLNCFNPNTGSFVKYYEKDGLPDNFIKGLIIDDSGVLRITTNKGICQFNLKQNEFTNFTKANGLQGNEFSERSVLKTKSGAIYMGGNKGFNVFYPDKIAINKRIPDVLITDLKIFNKQIEPGTPNSPLEMSIMETNTLKLLYSQSVITFSFAVMDFTAPERNQYAYKLEGFDKEWIYSGNKREATYTNLDPGRYKFCVKGSNNDGIWNEIGTSIQVIVMPPWWETWWFILLAVFTVISTVVFIFMSRVRQLKNQKILLAKLVSVKTAELFELNASKDKFFSIIAHDLKNPFSSIIGFSEILKEEIAAGDLESFEEHVEIINVSAVQTLRLLENLLEWANSQTGKIIFKPLPVNLSELFNEEFKLLNDMSIAKSIELKWSAPDDLIVVADKNMLKTILRNLISNALKFTHKNGKVDVKAKIDNSHLEISVSDTGIGMKRDTIDKLFRIDANLSTIGTEEEKGTGLGLILCKEFIEKHGGKIWVESELGKGSVFKFVIPADNNVIKDSKLKG
jgi:signal transduction histidine kinase/ligand-binding sensor domain-containing protein